jgi:hypothetical protein
LPSLGNESFVLGVGGVDEEEIQDGPLSEGSLEISDMDIRGSLGAAGVEGGGGGGVKVYASWKVPCYSNLSSVCVEERQEAAQEKLECTKQICISLDLV